MNIHDRLYSRPPTAAALGAFKVINGVQGMRAEEQLLGIATAYAAVCARLDIDPREPLYLVARMKRDCHYRHENTLSAVDKYIDSQIKARL